MFGTEKKAGEGMAKADASGMNNAAGVAYGDLIRKYRKQAGMNQEELGALARVHKNAVGAWEAGRSRPDLGSVPRICEALGLTLNEFFGTQAAPESKNESEAFISRFEQLTADHRRVVLREMDLLLALQEKRTAPRPLVKVYRNELSACAGPGLGIGEAAGYERTTRFTTYATLINHFYNINRLETKSNATFYLMNMLSVFISPTT